MPSTSTTGQLANISLEMITRIRYTIEHDTPMMNVMGDYKLRPGEDTGIFPRVGQVNVRVLNEGEEMSNEQDFGLSTLSAQTNEIGGYIIVTDRLLSRTARSAGNLFTVAARQFGDAKSRKMNEDGVGLFSALNGGTDLGSAGIPFSAANAVSAYSIAKTNRMGEDIVFVHHPNAVARYGRDQGINANGVVRPIPAGFSANVARRGFWSGMNVLTAPLFQTGDITRDGSDDAIGAVFQRGEGGALAMLRSGVPKSYRDRLNRRRGFELGFVSEWLAFELDDTYGAPITCDAVNPTLV